MALHALQELIHLEQIATTKLLRFGSPPFRKRDGNIADCGVKPTGKTVVKEYLGMDMSCA